MISEFEQLAEKVSPWLNDADSAPRERRFASYRCRSRIGEQKLRERVTKRRTVKSKQSWRNCRKDDGKDAA